jgi:hypothetical protein
VNINAVTAISFEPTLVKMGISTDTQLLVKVTHSNNGTLEMPAELPTTPVMGEAAVATLAYVANSKATNGTVTTYQYTVTASATEGTATATFTMSNPYATADVSNSVNIQVISTSTTNNASGQNFTWGN